MAYYNELRKYGTKAALIDENGNEMTYEQLDDECVRLGSKLGIVENWCLFFAPIQ